MKKGERLVCAKPRTLNPANMHNNNHNNNTKMIDKRMHTGIPMGKACNKAVDTVAYSVRRPALVVRGASKKYGSQLVLHNLNMFAKEGTIYALVGSGCSGKSTVLQCISGLKTFTKGELLIFGTQPGTTASGIPGRRVGYLSQELALHKEFTVTEAVQYYGRLYGMTLEKIKERLETLSNILSLQNYNERLSRLSRSEQKRTSLACALIHEPELIVLDEPTIGLDPLFKRGIWTYLTKLVSDGRTSVILASQNIEEARQAHRVGVLRGGRLIVEDSPIALLQRHNSPLLEDVIARICYKETAKANAENKASEKKGKGKNGIEELVLVEDWSAYGMQNGLPPVTETDIKSISYSEWMDQVSHEEDSLATKKAKPLKKKEMENLPPYPNPSRLICRLRALAIKQLILTQRNFGYILLRFALTALLISLFCVAIGPDPKRIRMGLLDNDSRSEDIVSECLEEEDMTFGCKPEKMSCRFLRTIQNDLVEWTQVKDIEDAEDALKRGKIAGYLEFTSMFSSEVFNKVVNTENEDEATTENYDNDGTNSLVVHLDSSDTFISRLLRTEFFEKYKAFEEGIAADCDGFEKSFTNDFNSTVMKMEDTPLNGNYEQVGYYSRFMLPGVSLVIIFLVTSMTSGLQFHKEIRQGILMRSFSAGVNTIEVLIFHWMIEIILMLVHVALVFVIPIFAFNLIPLNAFWPWPVLLFGITGVAGLTLSFMAATLSLNRFAIITFSFIFLIPNLLFSGVLWPVESLILPLQWISYFLPLSLASQSARYMIIAGWDIAVIKVWQGFVAISSWTLAHWIITLLVILCKHLLR